MRRRPGKKGEEEEQEGEEGGREGRSETTHYSYTGSALFIYAPLRRFLCEKNIYLGEAVY